MIREECQWRPIEEMHEDHGPCVVIDIEDPGRLAIGHICDIERDWEEWATHFAKLPRLDHEDYERLLYERSSTEPAKPEATRNEAGK